MCMKKLTRGLALLLACFFLASGAFSEGQVTVSEEEYALLQKYKRLEDIMTVIDERFLFEYDKDALMEGAALGMLASLGDNYSFYYTAAAMESEEEAFTGEYGGLGIEVFSNPNDMTITIRRVFYGGPAQQAGVRDGDKIIAVNGEEMTAFDVNRAVSIMRGEIGEKVTLTILREGEPELLEIECERAIVQTEIITSELLDGGIGYLRFHYFEGNATNQFMAVKKEFEEKGVKGVILDLRDNPGGFIDLAIDIAGVFLDDALVTTTEDRYGRTVDIYTDKGRWDIPLVVLINGYSASSSEILAAALHDHGVAKLVGEKSFGKGIVQSVYPFQDDRTGMQLTTDYWLTPNGEKIHEIGIEPDVVVELAEDAVDDNFMLIKEKDNQLQAAVALLQEEIAGAK